MRMHRVRLNMIKGISIALKGLVLILANNSWSFSLVWARTQDEVVDYLEVKFWFDALSEPKMA